MFGPIKWKLLYGQQEMNEIESRIYQIPFLETYHKVVEEVTFCIFTTNVTGIMKRFTEK